MRNVLLMGVNWNSPCGALSRWCDMTILSAWRSVLVKLGQEIVVVNKILMRFIFYLSLFSPPPGSSFVAGLSEKQVINLVWPYYVITNFDYNITLFQV